MKEMKVKVIKKDEIKATAAAPVKPAKSKRASARQVVSNVTTWVSDFQARKSVETKIAIEKFFNQAQPNES